MSYRRDVGSYTVPFVIRNQKSRHWPTMAMRICMLASLVSCVAAVVLLRQRAPLELGVLLLFSALLGVGGSLSIAFFLLTNRQVDKLLLGDVLETRPKKSRWEIDDIKSIQFLSSPEEDYREWDHLAHARETLIILRRIQGVQTIPLLLNSADARQLHEWARKHEIQVGVAEIEP